MLLIFLVEEMQSGHKEIQVRIGMKCVELQKLTSFKDYAVVGYFVPSLQAGAVPAVPSELVLALVDGNLDSLDCWSRHVWITHAHLQLAPRQTWQCQTHRVGIQDWVNVGKLQAQDFIGVYPAWSTQVRLLTRQTTHKAFVCVVFTCVSHDSRLQTWEVLFLLMFLGCHTNSQFPYYQTGCLTGWSPRITGSGRSIYLKRGSHP